MQIKYLTLKQLQKANRLAQKNGWHYLDPDVVESSPPYRFPVVNEIKLDAGCTRTNIEIMVDGQVYPVWLDIRDDILDSAKSVEVKRTQPA